MLVSHRIPFIQCAVVQHTLFCKFAFSTALGTNMYGFYLSVVSSTFKWGEKPQKLFSQLDR